MRRSLYIVAAATAVALPGATLATAPSADASSAAASTTLALTSDGSSGTSTYLGSYTARLTATVSPASAAGTVAVSNANGSLGQATVQDGVATLNVSLPQGQHSLMAKFEPSDESAAASNAYLGFTVSKPPMGLEVSPAGPVAEGSTVTLTATYEWGPYGSIQFFDGTTLVASRQSAGNRVPVSVTIPSVAAGTHMYSVRYSESGAPATSNTVPYSALPADASWPAPMTVATGHVTADASRSYDGGIATIGPMNRIIPGNTAAFIDWGDGTSSTWAPRGYLQNPDVTGAHGYSSRWYYTVRVYVRDYRGIYYGGEPGSVSTSG